MSAAPLIINDSSPDVWHVTLNRPEKRNALNLELMQKLAETFENLPSGVRAILLKGAGAGFCAGLDLVEANDPKNSEACARAVVRLLRAVFECKAVTLVGVHGFAVAGGAGLMSACDLVVMTHEARIGYPEIKRGLVAASVMALLRRQVRERDARELLVLGELINAETALRIGLVNRVVSVVDLSRALDQYVELVLEGGPGAIADTKRLLNELWPCNLEKDFDQTLQLYLSARKSDEAEEGIHAFLEKRPPRWQKHQ